MAAPPAETSADPVDKPEQLGQKQSSGAAEPWRPTVEAGTGQPDGLLAEERGLKSGPERLSKRGGAAR
ncbi:MAG: hypothetical protein ACR2QK_15840 [Acidimicrobiales bacterium]